MRTNEPSSTPYSGMNANTTASTSSRPNDSMPLLRAVERRSSRASTMRSSADRRSSTDTSNRRATACSESRLGEPPPVSHFDTAVRDTYSLAASCSWVRPRSVRSAFSFSPKSMGRAPFQAPKMAEPHRSGKTRFVSSPVHAGRRLARDYGDRRAHLVERCASRVADKLRLFEAGFFELRRERCRRSFFDGSSAFEAIILPSDIMLFPNMTPRPKEHRGEAAAHRESVRGMVRRRRQTRRAASRRARPRCRSSRSVGAGSLRRAGRARHSRQTRVGQTAEVLEGVRENSDRARARQPMRPRFYVSAR